MQLWLCLSGMAQITLAQQATCISQAVYIQEEDIEFTGTENILLVPENRQRADSRQIGLHFLHFPAKEPSNLPPVVFLGAGPGEPYSTRHFYQSYQGPRAKAWTWEMMLVNQKRDLILINQRGNPDAPGLPPRDFVYRWKNGYKDKPFDLVERQSNRRKALEQCIEESKTNGMDIEGYDILHLVGDIEAVRQHYGYEKLAFIGTSFGSQWGLAYIQLHPEHCDRALFSGVEPLDHAYDDPKGLWAVLEQIETYAKEDPALAASLPKVGLMEAFKTIVQRLEKAPVDVHLQVASEEIDETIPLGVDDFRLAYMNPFARGKVASIESWPKYISELYKGDYRTLAYRSRGRDSYSTSYAMGPLIDNSLGISAQRDSLLDSRESRKWLGDINLYYKETRKACPPSKLDDSFRQQRVHDIPLLLIQGDMDRSTPHENATYLMQFLNNGHLLTVKRGTHSAKRAMILQDPELARSVYQFMNVDFEKTPFPEWKRNLPTEFELPKFEFWPIEGESLFDKYSSK